MALVGILTSVDGLKSYLAKALAVWVLVRLKLEIEV
jgi:hypothetical protein